MPYFAVNYKSFHGISVECANCAAKMEKGIGAPEADEDRMADVGVPGLAVANVLRCHGKKCVKKQSCSCDGDGCIGVMW